MDFPVSLKDYDKIEEQNNVNINVFGYENKQFYPIYVSKQKNEDILNLLRFKFKFKAEGEKTLLYVLPTKF